MDYDLVRNCTLSRMEIKELIDLYLFRNQVKKVMMSFELTEKGQLLLEEICRGG